MAYGSTTKTPAVFEKFLNETEKANEIEESIYKKLGVRKVENRCGTLLRKYFPNIFETRYNLWKELPE